MVAPEGIILEQPGSTMFIGVVIDRRNMQKKKKKKKNGVTFVRRVYVKHERRR